MATETRKRFNEEFRAARNSGAKEFEFEGKKYTTKFKDDDSSPPAKKQSQDASKAGGAAVGSQKTQDKPQELYKPKSTSELSPAERKKRDDMESSQALEGSHPEFLLNPGRTVLGAIARPLETADKVRSAVATGANAIKNSAPAQALREAQFTRAAAKDANDIAASGRAQAASETAKDLKRTMPELDEAPMKRGGAVKKMASGGSVSASRRGDGIAQRGKTRGKVC